MNNDIRFELLVIDYLTNSLEGSIFYDKDNNTFDDDFNLVYLGLDLHYTYEEIADRINRLEQFGILKQNYFDVKKTKWKISLAIPLELSEILAIDDVKATVFRTAQKLGVYALSDLETLTFDAFNYIVNVNVEASYDEIIKEGKKNKNTFTKYESVAKDIELNDYSD